MGLVLLLVALGVLALSVVGVGYLHARQLAQAMTAIREHLDQRLDAHTATVRDALERAAATGRRWR